MKMCSKCKKVNPRKGGRYCKGCHAEYIRLNRKKWVTPESRKRSNARAYLHVYVKRGKVGKKPCEACGNKKAEGHHWNYDLPLDVRWLCRKHHMEQHKLYTHFTLKSE